MIEIHSLRKKYHHFLVLDHIDLTIPSGCLFALLGPNGSGKTTLLKSLLGIVNPEGGSSVFMQGKSILGTISYKNQIGYMPQNPKFPLHMRVCEMISFFEKLRGKKGKRKDVLIDELEITSFLEKRFGELSGGMIQKVNILQCFMFDNVFFVLDEPTSGLDPHVSFYLKKIMREEKENGNTILFTSHVMSQVEELADQMAFLVEGKVHTVSSPDELKKRENAVSLEEALYHFWSLSRKQ